MDASQSSLLTIIHKYPVPIASRMDVFAASAVARRKVGVADHILEHTYPLVKDPKLLLSALQNLSDAIDAGVEALLLQYGHEVPRSFGDRIEELRRVQRVPDGFVRFVNEVRDTLQDHRESPVEFVRSQRFVICDPDYRLRTLAEDQVKGYVRRAKVFIAMMEEKVHDAGLA